MPTPVLVDIRNRRNAMYRTVQACTACDRSELKSPTPGRGPIPSDFMMVSDVPGSINLEILDGKLHNAGLPSLRSWYLTTAVKCRRDVPEAHQIAACHGTVRAEIDVVDPRWILLLGAHALHSSGISTPIGKCHGRPFVPPMGPYRGRVCLPTFHPSVIYKNEHSGLLLTSDLSTFYGVISGRLNLSSVEARVGRNGKLDLRVEAQDHGQ